MTVAATPRTAGPFAGNDATTAFPFTFKVFTADDVAVYVTDTSGVQTLLSSGYTVMLNADQDNNPGGTVTYPAAGTPLATGASLAITGDSAYQQATALADASRFAPATVEDALDYVTILTQQLLEQANRTPHYPAGDTATGQYPTVTARAGKFLSFDGSGNPQASSGTGADAGLRTDLAAAIGAALVGWKQSGTGAVSQSLQNKLRDQSLSAKDFGAVEDNSTDDTFALNLAMAACVVTGIHAIKLTGFCKITDELAPSVPIIFWSELGQQHAGFRQTTANKGCINFANPTLIQGGGVDNITLEAGAGWVTAGFMGQGSTGTGLRVSKSNGKFFVRNVGIHNFARAAKCLGSWYTRWEVVDPMYCTNGAILIDTSDETSAGTTGGGNSFSHVKPSNNGFTGTNTASVGIDIRASGGDVFEDVDATAFNTNIRIQPDAGKQVSYCRFLNVLGDTADTHNWVIDASAGIVVRIMCALCWGSYATNGYGLYVKGANLDGFTWTGGGLNENGKEGWYWESGKNVYVDDCDGASNGKLAANTYPGATFAANVSHGGLTNSRFGNFASAFSTQAEGVVIVGGTSDYLQLFNNDFANAGAGKVAVANGSTGANNTIAFNTPYQQTGANFTLRQQLALTSGATNPAGASTTYMASAGAFGSREAGTHVMSKPGVCVAFYIGPTSAPGIGQSYTYTVMKNTTAQAMTGTISGASSSPLLVNTNAFTYTTGDELSLRLVNSATGATCIHRGYLVVEP